MILDAFTRTANAQAQTGSNEVSASSIDLGAPTVKRRIGAGEPISAIWAITTAAAGDSNSLTDTCDFEIIEATDAALTTSVTVCAARRVAGASLTAGAVITLDMPHDRPTKQYIGTRVSLGTGDTLSASAWIVNRSAAQAFIAYAKNYVV